MREPHSWTAGEREKDSCFFFFFSLFSQQGRNQRVHSQSQTHTEETAPDAMSCEVPGSKGGKFGVKPNSLNSTSTLQLSHPPLPWPPAPTFIEPDPHRLRSSQLEWAGRQRQQEKAPYKIASLCIYVQKGGHTAPSPSSVVPSKQSQVLHREGTGRRQKRIFNWER